MKDRLKQRPKRKYESPKFTPPGNEEKVGKWAAKAEKEGGTGVLREKEI